MQPQQLHTTSFLHSVDGVAVKVGRAAPRKIILSWSDRMWINRRHAVACCGLTCSSFLLGGVLYLSVPVFITNKWQMQFVLGIFLFEADFWPRPHGRRVSHRPTLTGIPAMVQRRETFSEYPSFSFSRRYGKPNLVLVLLLHVSRLCSFWSISMGLSCAPTLSQAVIFPSAR